MVGVAGGRRGRGGGLLELEDHVNELELPHGWARKVNR